MASAQILTPIAGAAAAVYGTAGAADTAAGLKTAFFARIMADHLSGASSLPLTGPAAGVLVLAALNCRPEQSKLSRAFSTAAAWTGIFALAGALTHTPDSVLPAAICYGATALSGACSALSYATRNAGAKAPAPVR
jgi:hypothetical protein